VDPWNLLATTLEAWGIPCSDESLVAMRHFYALLLEGNKTANLTRITGEEEAVVKHFLDSLSVLRVVPEADRSVPRRILDVGAGAGFPGIPLLLANPTWTGTMLEATGKKVAFMAQAMETLGVGGTALHARAEDLGKDAAHREGYDLVVARAVAELNVLAELCLPFARIGGRMVAMKAASAPAEVAAAKKAIATLGGRLDRIDTFALPEGYGERSLIVVEKVAPTPSGYPRRVGQPAAKPLC